MISLFFLPGYIESLAGNPENIIGMSFKTCCITNALDGSEDDIHFVEERQDDEYIYYTDNIDQTVMTSTFDTGSNNADLLSMRICFFF